MPGYESDYSAAENYQHSLPVERLEGVRTRRVLAFCIDYLIVGLIWFVAAVAVFFVGILTLGLGWLLYPILFVLVVLAYVGMTMGGPNQATLGMNFFSIRIERDDGSPVDGITAIVHTCLFWAAHVALTPILLVISLFSSRKKLIQDILLGTVIVRSDR